MKGRFRMDFSTEENPSESFWSLSRVLQAAVLQKSSCRALPLAILRPQVEIPTSSQGLPSAGVFAPQPFMLPVGREFLTFSVADPFWDSKDFWDKQDVLLRDSELADCNHVAGPWLKPAGCHRLLLVTQSFLACLLLSCFQSTCFKRKKLAEETCTTGYLMQILLKWTDTYIHFWLVVAVHE